MGLTRGTTGVENLFCSAQNTRRVSVLVLVLQGIFRRSTTSFFRKILIIEYLGRDRYSSTGVYTTSFD
jgi:hypothetical protein